MSLNCSAEAVADGSYFGILKEALNGGFCEVIV
jgi:hypothetical protein